MLGYQNDCSRNRSDKQACKGKRICLGKEFKHGYPGGLLVTILINPNSNLKHPPSPVTLPSTITFLQMRYSPVAVTYNAGNHFVCFHCIDDNQEWKYYDGMAELLSPGDGVKPVTPELVKNILKPGVKPGHIIQFRMPKTCPLCHKTYQLAQHLTRQCLRYGTKEERNAALEESKTTLIKIAYEKILEIKTKDDFIAFLEDREFTIPDKPPMARMFQDEGASTSSSALPVEEELPVVEEELPVVEEELPVVEEELPVVEEELPVVEEELPVVEEELPVVEEDPPIMEEELHSMEDHDGNRIFFFITYTTDEDEEPSTSTAISAHSAMPNLQLQGAQIQEDSTTSESSDDHSEANEDDSNSESGEEDNDEADQQPEKVGRIPAKQMKMTG
ncbi:uncharacterized protein LOC143804055 [Ranitomeya variabilis]|uniref:uncharacterized protein LOC143804055 n=1 Tax=Ranitomeya variabilis TaxID=490064 RepID=UPI004055EF65